MAKTRLNAEAIVSAAPDPVARILCSEDFIPEIDLKREEVVEATYNLIEQTDDKVIFEINEVHYKHTKTGALDKSGTNSHRAEYRYDAKNKTLGFDFGNKGKILVKGTYTISPEGSGSRLAFELNLDVRIPIVGRMIAGLMKKELAKSFDDVVVGLKERLA